MSRRRLIWAVVAAAFLTLPAACSRGGAPAGTAQPGGLRLQYEDVLEPRAYLHAGLAVVEPPSSATGLWAVAPGLPRPERARVEHLDTGASIDVSLFSGGGRAVRLSPQAAAAIGVGADPAPVRVTALRREPRIASP